MRLLHNSKDRVDIELSPNNIRRLAEHLTRAPEEYTGLTCCFQADHGYVNVFVHIEGRKNDYPVPKE